MTDKKSVRIIELRAENVKRLTAVHIKPDGNIIVIGGRNGQGKTSVLDSIAYALGGKGLCPSDPVHHGEDGGEVEVDLGDLVVKRRFKPDGRSYLTVDTKDGMRYPSPQSVLDELVGRLSFDPLEFSHMKPAEQAQTLKNLVGLDFTEMDQERKQCYDKRTAINRDTKRIEGAIASIEVPDGTPDAEVSIAKLTEELEARRDHNENNAELFGRAKIVSQNLKENTADIHELQVRLQQLQELDKELRADLQEIKTEIDNTEPNKDLGEIREKINGAEKVNANVRKSAERKRLQQKRKATLKESSALTDRINKIDAEKESALSSAKFPIKGLAFDESGVTYKGVPFDQSSDAEKVRVSVAMGIALNPDLKVLLIRNGSLLDSDNLALIAEMADKNDTQIWIERVGEGDEVSIVIEDGHVKK